MKDKRIKLDKGITLIALVITIIVLLILAGVAISMLSGENGILRKAAEAKTKTEEGQKQEETALLSMELETYFQTENKKYKCSNGFITGIEVETKVSELQSALPEGYMVKAVDGTDKFTATDNGKEDGTPIVTTGLTIQKDSKTVARTVIFGDTNCDGKIKQEDADPITNIVTNVEGKQEYGQYVLIAMDVNHDNVINTEDSNIISNYVLGKSNILQNKYASSLNGLLAESYLSIQSKYIDIFKENIKKTSYTIEWSEENNLYLLRGIDKDTMTVDNLLKILLGDLSESNNSICIYGIKDDDYVKLDKNSKMDDYSLIQLDREDSENIMLCYIKY